MKAIIYGVLMALTVMAASAAEDVKSANYMMPGCKIVLEPLGRSQDTFYAGDCIGTVQGIAFMLGFNPGGLWCAEIPAAVTHKQMVRVVVQYIEARPKDMHEPFNMLAVFALVDAWPCKQ